MISESLYFMFDGVKSSDFGIMNVSIKDGLYEEQFIPSKTIREETVRGRSKRYFQGIESEPLEIPLSFYFTDTWDNDKIRQIARWLSVDYYKPLIFSENPDRIFYAMPIQDFKVIHNGLKQGYLTLTMRCNDSYSYSPEYLSPIYDLSSNTVDGTIIEFENKGDENLYPEMWIEKVGAGDISIINLSNGGKEFRMTGLADAETVYIDNENEDIETDLSQTYRYNNHNGVFVEILKWSVNRLKVVGNAKLRFRYQLKRLQ